MSEPSAKVLVCDDDDPTREMLITFLETEGFEVTGVPDGPSCLAAVAAERPDVLVLDVMMPGMNGYDEDVWAGWRSGVDYYMAKPFDVGELLRFVHFVASGAPAE